jgi:serine/threonine-protein kinase
MTPERWQEIEHLYHAARDRDSCGRETFLKEACSGDEELRRVVESLLALETEAQEFMEAPALDVAAKELLRIRGRDDSLASTASAAAAVVASSSSSIEGRFIPGTILAGRYRIVALLGTGGMGEVYRATDLKLDQQIALKFLPESTAHDPAVVARFHNEVRMARKLTHPNICRVYDIVEANGLQFISMEYVDGEDLASLLCRIGRVPQDKAAEIARKLCFGIAAAHEQGILHRDLKPANIMIDRQGRVRLMDFGLAELAHRLPREDARSGTPAYMAPEQIAGNAPTIKSDLYALGLVLYELFTGARAFGRGATREHLPAAPSEVVRDIDLAVDRAILNCLEPDPADRPSSSISVAAALPGPDLLTTVLAAGETPSPEMVAQAGPNERLRQRTAAAYLALVIAGTLALTLIGANVNLIVRALNKPPEVLAHQAVECLARLGYSKSPKHRAYGFYYAQRVLRYLAQRQSEQPNVATLRPAPVRFWYRQSPRFMEARSGRVTRDDPPPLTPGMVNADLDSDGRLVGFSAVLPEHDTGTAPAADPDTNLLFEVAGIPVERFTPAVPQWIPETAFDARFAWTGSYPDAPEIRVRLEAAYWRSNLVWFRTKGPWSTPTDDTLRASRGERVSEVLIDLVFMMTVAGALLLARHNTRIGRGDRRGAARLALLLFVLELLIWAGEASHVPDLTELNLLFSAFENATWIAVLAWIMYLALEPYLRRQSPELLVSWSRFVRGDWTDPLIGTHVLIGAVAGVSFALLTHATLLVDPHVRFSSDPPAPWLSVLLGGRHTGGMVLDCLADAITRSVGMLAMLFLVRLAVRSRIVASAVVIIVWTVIVTAARGGNTPLQAAFALAGVAISIYLLQRYGLLALVSGAFVLLMLTEFPVTADSSSPYFGIWLFATLLVALLVAVAFQIATAGRIRL